MVNATSLRCERLGCRRRQAQSSYGVSCFTGSQVHTTLPCIWDVVSIVGSGKPPCGEFSSSATPNQPRLRANAKRTEAGPEDAARHIVSRRSSRLGYRGPRFRKGYFRLLISFLVLRNLIEKEFFRWEKATARRIPIYQVT